MNKLFKIARKFEIRLAQQKPTRVAPVTIIGDPNAPDRSEDMGQGGQTGGQAGGQGGQRGQGGRGGQTNQGGQEAGSNKAVMQHGDSSHPIDILKKAGWKFRIYYTPHKQEEKNFFLQKGYKPIQGVGLVPPDEVQFVTQALAKGWKNAGGYGLLPPNWYNYLVKNNYI